MRLICPNCGAQYEVTEDAIPELGRDVQCSNCGHTWFETPSGLVADGDAPIGKPSAPAASAEQATKGDAASTDFQNQWGSSEDAGRTATTTATGAGDSPVASEPDLPDDEPIPMATQSTLDGSVADILREEAKRETAARSGDPIVEPQTDMPLDPPSDQRTAESQDRIATLKGEEAANAAAVAAMTAGSRKDDLPDVDELNSTLRTNAERGEKVAPPPEVVEAMERKGFRWGFWGSLLLILLAVLIYLFADQLIAAVPSSESTVTSYSAAVDDARNWVAGLAGNDSATAEGQAVSE